MYIKDNATVNRKRAAFQFLLALSVFTIAVCVTMFIPTAYAMDSIETNYKEGAITICHFVGGALAIIGIIRFFVGFTDGGTGPEVRSATWMIAGGFIVYQIVPGMIQAISLH